MSYSARSGDSNIDSKLCTCVVARAVGGCDGNHCMVVRTVRYDAESWALLLFEYLPDRYRVITLTTATNLIFSNE